MLVGPLLDRLEPQIRIVHRALDASPSVKHEILLNLRALADPESLRAIVERAFAALPARLTWQRVECFRPSPPVPHHRP